MSAHTAEFDPQTRPDYFHLLIGSPCDECGRDGPTTPIEMTYAGRPVVAHRLCDRCLAAWTDDNEPWEAEA